MMTNQEKHDKLLEKVADLAKRQDEFSEEIESLKLEIVSLSAVDTNEIATDHKEVKGSIKKKLRRDKTDKAISGVCSGLAKYFNINTSWIRLFFLLALILSFGLFFILYLLLIIFIPIGETKAPIPSTVLNVKAAVKKEQVATLKETKTAPPKPETKKPIISTSIERFIGENLINKIGIIIIVIGVAIGAKYSIENDLISPLTRIILGYLTGIALLGIGMYLKKKFESYSAVLVSGAMAIFYFITYFSYGFYELIPQEFAFSLMVAFTCFTVLAALSYNQQVIAIIGLIGAYVVPFLLGDDNGDVYLLFTYIAIINLGMLFVAFKKYWKPLYYFAFFATWIIYGAWYGSIDDRSEIFQLSLGFALIFFVTFYLAFLGYKVLKKEKFDINNIWLLLVNSFVFYGMGYLILNDPESTFKGYLGIFTLSNAIIHFIVSLFIYKQKLGDKNLFYLISGLVLVFITIAIPVQLEGNWVTMLWIGEGALLFWIGRSKEVSIYEKLAYPLMALAMISLTQDYLEIYRHTNFHWDKSSVPPFLNSNFLTSLVFIVALGFIAKINSKFIANTGNGGVFSLVISAVLMLSIYSTFRLEIVNYWNQLFVGSLIEFQYDGYNNEAFNQNLVQLKRIWVINYSLAFTVLLMVINFKRFRSSKLDILNVVLTALALTVFLSQGLFVLSELRENFLNQVQSEYYNVGSFNIAIRYISLIFFTLTLVSAHKFIQADRLPFSFKKPLEFFLHLSLIWILSSELIHWMDMSDSDESYKLGLSILWALYSLFLVIIGIWKTKKHLRIGGISLFGFTLVKLFFYDISHLDTIAKVIVFMSLGIVLLIVSFLYNKYNKVIDDTED